MLAGALPATVVLGLGHPGRRDGPVHLRHQVLHRDDEGREPRLTRAYGRRTPHPAQRESVPLRQVLGRRGGRGRATVWRRHRAQRGQRQPGVCRRGRGNPPRPGQRWRVGHPGSRTGQEPVRHEVQPWADQPRAAPPPCRHRPRGRQLQRPDLGCVRHTAQCDDRRARFWTFVQRCPGYDARRASASWQGLAPPDGHAGSASASSKSPSNLGPNSTNRTASTRRPSAVSAAAAHVRTACTATRATSGPSHP